MFNIITLEGAYQFTPIIRVKLKALIFLDK